MYTHERCAGLAPYQLPEMHRTPLHELCLQIKLLELGEIEDFLAKAPEAPHLLWLYLLWQYLLWL